MTFESLCNAVKDSSAGKSVNAMLMETPIGQMIAMGDSEYIYVLEFLDKKNLQKQVHQFCQTHGFAVLKGTTPLLQYFEEELSQYFQGKLQNFKTPVFLGGTDFQKSVWNRLLKIPYGTKISYGKQAQDLSRPQSFRTVANANGRNRLSIIVPCHRVVRGNGDLGGYAGGLDRKSWLLAHESKYFK